MRMRHGLKPQSRRRANLRNERRRQQRGRAGKPMLREQCAALVKRKNRRQKREIAEADAQTCKQQPTSGKPAIFTGFPRLARLVAVSSQAAVQIFLN